MNQFVNYGNGIQIGEVRGNVTINYGGIKSAAKAAEKAAEVVKRASEAAKNMEPTECSKCVYGEIMRPGTYKKGNTTIVNVSGSTTRCTKEKVSTMSFVDGDMVCGDYKERG